MDNMNSTNLHSLSVCDLNTKFNDRCHADWSRSNLISLVTLEGIYILKPQLDIQHGPFQIELIRNPTSKFKHRTNCEIGSTFDTIWRTLDNRQYMEVFLDPALMTNIETPSLDLYPRRFRLAKWSPVVEIFPRQCLLATITVDYQLLIYARKNNAWIVQADLSREYDKLWNQLYLTNDLKPSQENFESTRKNLHSLSFCNVCWKENKHNGPFLLATTIPGDIVVWQVILPDSNTQQPAQNNEPQLEVKIILQTNLDYISSMQLSKNLLIVAARGGQVVLYDLTLNFDEFEATPNLQEQQSNGLAEIRTLNLITIPPTATLWHRDNIEVTDFYIQPISPDTYRIVLAKSTNICWAIIKYTQRTDNAPATLAISDSFSAIDGSDPDVSLYQNPATWLKPAGNGKAVLIADDGSFFQIEFTGDQDTSPAFNAIRTGRVDLSRMVPRGLCTSSEGHLITMISSISLMYEPARVLAPTKLLLIPTVNDKKFFVDCIQKLLDGNWLEKEHIESPMNVCDRIDYLRSIYPSLIYEHYHELFKTLRGAILEIGRPKTDAQLVKLKIVAFLLVKLLEHGNSKKIEGDLKVDLDNKVYDAILLYNIEKILSATLAESNKVKKRDFALNVDQINSMRNYFNWLDICPELKERFIDRFKITESKYANTPPESCSICHNNIPFTSIKYGTCCNGHQFDRCARSLLIISSKTGNELVCEHCKRHYMTYMVWPSKNLWLCSYCQ